MAYWGTMVDSTLFCPASGCFCYRALHVVKIKTLTIGIRKIQTWSGVCLTFPASTDLPLRAASTYTASPQTILMYVLHPDIVTELLDPSSSSETYIGSNAPLRQSVLAQTSCQGVLGNIPRADALFARP